ncbi:hypothetical protein [Frankia sp. CiP3]|nr:hypothetical protein [Frankia sp. CiP3]
MIIISFHVEENNDLTVTGWSGSLLTRRTCRTAGSISADGLA